MSGVAVEVRFYSLTGAFAVAKKETFASEPEAFAAIQAYAEPHGFSGFKQVHDDDPCDVRVIAKTPGGCAGRNVASYVVFDPEEMYT